jgi:hypothetical protein
MFLGSSIGLVVSLVEQLHMIQSYRLAEWYAQQMVKMIHRDRHRSSRDMESKARHSSGILNFADIEAKAYGERNQKAQSQQLSPGTREIHVLGTADVVCKSVRLQVCIRSCVVIDNGIVQAC